MSHILLSPESCSVLPAWLNMQAPSCRKLVYMQLTCSLGLWLCQLPAVLPLLGHLLCMLSFDQKF